jgi:hypothetical protein
MYVDGYGRFWVDGRYVRAHRFAYELVVGPIAEGLQLDHVKARGCEYRHCVNPAHLEPVTQQENIRRGDACRVAAARMADKTHCPQGHPFDEVNTYHDRRGWRGCRACRRASGRRRSGRRAAEGSVA